MKAVLHATGYLKHNLEKTTALPFAKTVIIVEGKT